MKRIVARWIVPWLALAAAATAQADTSPAEQATDYTQLVEAVDAATVQAWIDEGKPFRILDVRSEQEFLQDGHAPGAVLQSWNMKQDEAARAAFIDAVRQTFAADETVVVLCSRGGRAARAAHALQEEAGFSGLRVFGGGYEGSQLPGIPAGEGWKAAGLPMQDDPAAQPH